MTKLSIKRLRPSAVVTTVLASCALALTIDELAHPGYLNWPDGAFVGALVLLALLAATGWLVLATREHGPARIWARAALVLALLLPAIWLYRQDKILHELSALPDADLPPGWADRVSGDVMQTQVVVLVVTVGLLACALALSVRRP